MNNNRQFKQMDSFYNKHLNEINIAYTMLSASEKEKFLDKLRTELGQKAADDFLSRLMIALIEKEKVEKKENAKQ